MNQGKLHMVKQEMARVHAKMGEFNSDDYCTYYCGQESLRRNEVALIVKEGV